MLRSWQFAAYLSLLSPCIAADAQKESHGGVRSFLEDHCIRCHGPECQKSGRRFDGLVDPARDLSQLQLWEDILAQLKQGGMPPDGEPQPSDADRKAIAALIEEALATNPSGAVRPVLRRLTRFEYRNTLGDLLGLRTDLWDPTVGFPDESSLDGFDRAGGLVTSKQLLMQYLHSSRETLERATHFESRPKATTWTVDGPFHRALHLGEDRWASIDRFYDFDRYQPQMLSEPWTDLNGRGYRGGHAPFFPLRGGVKHSGYYAIRIRASAHHRTHDYSWVDIDFRNGDPLELQLYAVDHSKEGTEYCLGRVEVLEEEPAWFEFRCWLEKGYEPEIRFGNIGTTVKTLIRLFLKAATEEHPEFYAIRGLKPTHPATAIAFLKIYRGPTLRIHRMEVTGPELEDWPPIGHRRMYGDLRSGAITVADARGQIANFANLAFRRQVREGELDGVTDLMQDVVGGGGTRLEALQVGLQAVLCSPQFLYLEEPTGTLEDYALASRLSYFLFSSLPDPPLLALASEGKLCDSEVLSGQVERMLLDPRSDRFVDNFLTCWLELGNVDRRPPTKSFDAYYRNSIGTHMRTETKLFFRSMVDSNASILQLIDADYAFLNRPLAEHYGLAAIEGLEFQRVPLSNRARGGLIGSASFLTASANGVDTSPVVRGIYLLDKVLGRRPPPPPPDVPALEPDARGATTLREQLVRHREIPSCASCHETFDPLGFALENYDAIGRWRSEYKTGLPVDASGEISTGEKFRDVVELKGLLLERSDAFRRCLAEKLLGYAIGRRLAPRDRESVDCIVTEAQKAGDGLRDLIHRVVLSRVFRSN